MPQNSTQERSIRVGEVPRSGGGPRRAPRERGPGPTAWRPMSVRSTTAAPRIEASPTRNPSRRKGSFAPQPAVAPEPRSGAAIRDREDRGRDGDARADDEAGAHVGHRQARSRRSTATRSMSHPPTAAEPGAGAEARGWTPSAGVLSVSARMMFATA